MGLILSLTSYSLATLSSLTSRRIYIAWQSAHKRIIMHWRTLIVHNISTRIRYASGIYACMQSHAVPCMHWMKYRSDVYSMCTLLSSHVTVQSKLCMHLNVHIRNIYITALWFTRWRINKCMLINIYAENCLTDLATHRCVQQLG